MAAAILAGALALTSSAAADDDVESLEVEQLGSGTYRARGSFVIAAPTQAAWEAITDYDGIPRLAPTVELCRVVSRDGNNVVVEQEVVASVLFFSKRIRLLLQILESPQRAVAFRDVAGDDFKSYVGFWKLEEVSDSLRVSYGLDLERGFSAPDFVARSFFRKQAESVLSAMREDILRRAASDAPAAAAPATPSP